MDENMHIWAQYSMTFQPNYDKKGNHAQRLHVTKVQPELGLGRWGQFMSFSLKYVIDSRWASLIQSKKYTLRPRSHALTTGALGLRVKHLLFCPC